MSMSTWWRGKTAFRRQKPCNRLLFVACRWSCSDSAVYAARGRSDQNFPAVFSGQETFFVELMHLVRKNKKKVIIVQPNKFKLCDHEQQSLENSTHGRESFILPPEKYFLSQCFSGVDSHLKCVLIHAKNYTLMYLYCDTPRHIYTAINYRVTYSYCKKLKTIMWFIYTATCLKRYCEIFILWRAKYCDSTLTIL